MDHLSLSQFIFRSQNSNFLLLSLKPGGFFHPHALPGPSPISKESLEVMAYSSESVAAGTPSALREVPSASVDLNTSNNLNTL